MTAWLPATTLTANERSAMYTLLTVAVVAFVLGVWAVVAYALFKMSPFARHTDQFRDPRTGTRIGESPRLE
jgi:hypothetical protein